MDLKNIKVCFLGDSITEGVGASDMINKSYVGLFRKMSGAKVFNYGISATRFASQKEEPPGYTHILETYPERARRMVKDADIVFVFGGTNDFGHGDAPMGKEGDTKEDTFIGATYELFSYLKETYKNSRIIIMTPLHRASEHNLTINDYGAPQIKDLYKIVDIERKYAKRFGFEIIDLFNEPLLDTNNTEYLNKYFSDGLHPSDKGHELIANIIMEYLSR